MMFIDEYTIKAIILGPSQFLQMLFIVLHYQVRIAVSISYTHLRAQISRQARVSNLLESEYLHRTAPKRSILLL
jgi:hypothetical protein